jgi:hypothetical protein
MCYWLEDTFNHLTPIWCKILSANVRATLGDSGIGVNYLESLWLRLHRQHNSALFFTIADQLASVFTDTFNLSLTQSVIPACFKQTTIDHVPER